MITEEEKNDILSKYSGDTSDEILNYLKRHYPFQTHQLDWEKDLRTISINDKNYWIEGNKKLLVNKLSSYCQEKFPNTDNRILRRTVKKYIDGIIFGD